MSSQVVSPQRFRWVAFGAAGLFGLAVFSQARVQTFGSGDIKKLAEKTKRFVVPLTDYPIRGQILTADGKVVARDEGVYVLNIDYRRVPKSDAFFLDVGEAAGMSGSELIEFSKRTTGVRVWSSAITAEQKKRIDEVKTKWRADGLSADSTGRRHYPMSWMASSLVGLLGSNETSKGVEAALNEPLTGKAGFSKGLVDRTGAYLPMRMEADSVKRVDGSNVVLTIDSDLQQVAAQALRQAVELNKASSGIAIVIDPKTGDVLAMANWPSFDPATGQGPDGKSADFNPNIMGHFEPGSTMKILTLAKALDSGVVTDGWTGSCGGELHKGPYRIRCDSHHGNRAHGSVTLEKAIAVSCNVSAANWACGIGFEPYHQYINDLGLMDSLKIGLPSAVSGSVFIEPVAKTQELMCWGFGQSMGVTPLALAASCTALGNDGTWMKPRLVRSIGGKEQPVQTGKAVFSADTARKVMGFMEAVIDSDRGTGKTLRIPGYRLAGKTGTAQRLGRGGGNVANFIGFVPAVDPKAEVLVMIDRPSAGNIYGATVAGPVFLEIAKSVITKFNLQPSSGTTTEVKSTVAPQVEVKSQALPAQPKKSGEVKGQKGNL